MPVTSIMRPSRFAAPAQSYFPNGVVVDGTNDWLALGANYTGAVDTKLWTVTFALRLNGLGAFQNIIRGDEGTNIRYLVSMQSDDTLRVFCRNDAAVDICNFASSIALTTGQWYAVAISIDLANAANRHLRIDDVDRLGTVTTYTDDLIGISNVSWNGIGANPSSGGGKLNGELADVWHETGRYVDFSVEANRRLFFNASNCLVDKGSDGSTPFGAAPIAYFGDDNDETNWHLNNTGNGDLVVNGALGGSSEDPCGE